MHLSSNLLKFDRLELLDWGIHRFQTLRKWIENAFIGRFFVRIFPFFDFHPSISDNTSPIGLRLSRKRFRTLKIRNFWNLGKIGPRIGF